MVMLSPGRYNQTDHCIYVYRILHACAWIRILSSSVCLTNYWAFQKMEVLRKDVEAMEREMEELRAYLAKTEGNREEVINRSEDDGIGLNRQEHGKDSLWSLRSVIARDILTVKRGQ